MLWITPLLVVTSAVVPCDVVHRDLVNSNCHCQLGALQAPTSALLPQVRAHALSNRADMVLHRVCLNLASEKLFCSGA